MASKQDDQAESRTDKKESPLQDGGRDAAEPPHIPPPEQQPQDSQVPQEQSTESTSSFSSGSSPPTDEEIKFAVAKLMSVLKDEDINVDVEDGTLNVDVEINEDNIQRIFYRMISFWALLGVDLFLFANEDGTLLSREPDAIKLSDRLGSMAKDNGVDEETAAEVQRTLLGSESATSPVVVHFSGGMDQFQSMFGYEVEAGHVFLAELKEGWEPARASRTLCDQVKDQFPGFRIALLPFPDREVNVEKFAAEFGLNTSRRCSLLLFKEFSLIQLNFLSLLAFPALVAALFQLKSVAVSIPGVSSDYASVESAIVFGLAALLPAASAFLARVAWLAAYKKPINSEFLPVLAPGAGISIMLMKYGCVPDSRRMTIDLALSTSLVCLATSLALLKSSSCSSIAAAPALSALPSLEAFGIPQAASAAFPGTVLVPDSFLGHSGFFNQMADRLSCAALPDPRSATDVLFAMPPLALAGVLGLHLTAMCLVPYASSNGGRIIEGLVEDEDELSTSQLLSALFVLGCMVLTGAPAWIIFASAPILCVLRPYPPSNRPVRWDGITRPGFGRAILGLSLVTCGVFVMLPQPLYDWVVTRGLAPFVDSLMLLLMPAT